MFGSQVNINFKGKQTVTTKLGSLFTLVTVGLGFAYFGTLVSKLLNRTDPKIN
jgi:hypothetical protein